MGLHHMLKINSKLKIKMIHETKIIFLVGPRNHIAYCCRVRKFAVLLLVTSRANLMTASYYARSVIVSDKLLATACSLFSTDFSHLLRFCSKSGLRHNQPT